MLKFLQTLLTKCLLTKMIKQVNTLLVQIQAPEFI